jgi:hypothetical protein
LIIDRSVLLFSDGGGYWVGGEYLVEPFSARNGTGLRRSRASPHNSAQGAGAHDISLRRAVENCRRALTGGAPLHVIGLDERMM